MSKKYCYLFTEGNAKMRELLGGKGANLAEMTNIGLPVPQGFTITTEACTQYYEDGRQINDEIMAEIMEYIEKMEKITGKKFGDHENPLLVSVRSGARASMPGMMDTILNLGLNEDVVAVIAAKSNNPRWAWDCYRRFIQMYSDVVMEVGKKYFEQLIDAMKEKKGVTQDVELDANDLKELAMQFKAEYKAKIGEDFPTDPKEQLIGAIKAVFRSWDNPRANVYRRNERMSAMMKILAAKPNRIFTLSYFCDLFGSAKSTMSEDIDILRDVVAHFGLGELETVTGAAGGVRYRTKVRRPEARKFIGDLCQQLSEEGRVLPGGFLYYSDILSTPEIVTRMGEIMATEYYAAAPDFVLTMETKGIPVAFATANALGVPLVIARRSSKVYEGSAVNINYVSGSSGHIETMSLSRRAVQEGQKCLIVDDFLKGGGTARRSSSSGC